jgi:hypothetical protein
MLKRVAALAALSKHCDRVGGISAIDALLVDDRFARMPAVGACFFICTFIRTAVGTHLFELLTPSG